VERSAKAIGTERAAGIGGVESVRQLLGRRSTASILRDYGIVVAFIVLFVVLALTTPNFLSVDNLLNVLNQNAFIGIAACGATLVIIGGGFDLSQGAVYALSGAVAAWGVVHANPALGLAAGVLVGPVLGVLNGVLVSVLGIHSFLATLASGLMFAGLAIAVTGGFLIDASDSAAMTWLGREELIGGIPNPILLFALVVVAFGFVLSSTKLGRYVYAVGGNPEAARLSGVRVGAVTAATFVLSGLTASLAGLVEVSKSGTGQAAPGGTDTLALSAIAAVVIGGTSIKGGQGAIWRTVLGVLLLALITNAFNILNIEPQYQGILTGAIIVLAVAVNTLAARR
jgi:ribose transport system permease protein